MHVKHDAMMPQPKPKKPEKSEPQVVPKIRDPTASNNEVLDGSQSNMIRMAYNPQQNGSLHLLCYCFIPYYTN